MLHYNIGVSSKSSVNTATAITKITSSKSRIPGLYFWWC